MKQLFLSLFVLLTFVVILTNVRCNSEANAKMSSEEITSKWQTVEYDNCQYIVYTHNIGSYSGLYSMTHKGNCDNPIHKK